MLRRMSAALGSVLMLAAPAVLAAGPESAGTVFLQPPAAPAPHANTELGNRIDSVSGLVVAGERLNAGLLRRFYARPWLRADMGDPAGAGQFTVECRVARRRSRSRP